MNITSNLITGVMGELVSKLYDMHNENELSLITFHLLRVGTCCTLFFQGLPKEENYENYPLEK